MTEPQPRRRGSAEPRSARKARQGIDELELSDWIESLDELASRVDRRALAELLERLEARARELGASVRRSLTTPYINTIGVEEQAPYPGSLEIERRLRNLVRYNAMAIVVRANREHDAIGGHISTYASCAT